MGVLLADKIVSTSSEAIELPPPHLLLDDIDHARETETILRTAWWQAYEVKGRGEVEAEAEHIAKGALNRVISEAKLRFGNNRAHPDCDYCLTVFVFGGPGHEPSSFCRSGKRPHCTCNSCF